jgi:hypothetical protein
MMLMALQPAKCSSGYFFIYLSVFTISPRAAQAKPCIEQGGVYISRMVALLSVKTLTVGLQAVTSIERTAIR